MTDKYEQGTNTEFGDAVRQWQEVSNSRTKKLSAPTASVPQNPFRIEPHPQHAAKGRDVKNTQGSAKNVSRANTPAQPGFKTGQTTRPVPTTTRQRAMVNSAAPLQQRSNERPSAPTSLGPPVADVRLPFELLQKHNLSYQAIAQEFGVQARPLHHGSREIGLWGEPKAVDVARQALLAWSAASLGTHRQHAKIYSLTPAQRMKEEKAWDQDVAKHSFRMRPPPGMAFAAIGSFHWPVGHFLPQEVLGVNLERLDPIRTKAKCYIIWNGDRRVFQVMSQKSVTDVQTALRKIRATCFQIKAKYHPTVRMYLIYLPQELRISPTHLALVRYAPPTVFSAVPVQESVWHYLKPVAGAQGRNSDILSDQKQIAWNTAKDTLLVKLQTLHYRQGSLRLRFHLGVALLKHYTKPSAYGRYTMREFEALIKAPDFRIHVTQELGSANLESRLLPIVLGKPDSFDALDSSLHRLEDVKPVLTATFDFSHTSTSNIRLEVAWDEGTDHGTSTKRWYTREIRAEDPNVLDVPVINLNISHAWKLSLDGPHTLADLRVPAALTAFASTIKLAANAYTSSRPVSYAECKSLLSCQIRASYRFLFAHSDVILEVTRFEDQQFDPPRQHECRWGVDVYRTDWDAMFAQNENLEVGGKTKWPHGEEDWFPADAGYGAPQGGNGWEQFIDKLAGFERLLDGHA